MKMNVLSIRKGSKVSKRKTTSIGSKLLLKLGLAKGINYNERINV